MARNRFAADISEWVRVTVLSADLVLAKIGLDAYGALLKRSPVDTGRFRGGWVVGLNGPGGTAGISAVQRGAPMTTAERARARVLLKARFGDTIHITNGLPYAVRLERGHSKQAPSGILGPTFAELERIVRRAVNQAKREAR